ncbi:MAG TPA: hypothetical protein VGM06_14460 [Polyangiaceae bacterium]|jgi:hypothetical protein
MSTTPKSRASQNAADQKMIDGINKHLSQLASLPVGNTSYTPAQIIQFYQDRLTTSQAAADATAQRTAAIKADVDKQTSTSPTARAFRRIIVGMFAGSPDVLATFGLAAPKVTTRSVETKTSAVAKAKATRIARHTMGPKQKAKIHGTVPDPTESTPSPEPSPPSPQAGPAPSPAVPSASAVSASPAR